MSRYFSWRYFLFAMIVVLAVVYALPNWYGEDPAVQISTKNATDISLSVKKKVIDILTKEQILYLSIQTYPRMMIVRFPDSESQLKAQGFIQATLGDTYSIALNLATKTPRWLQAMGAYPMRLGLDLRGGIHFLLAVDVNSLIKVREKGDAHVMSTELRKGGVRYKQILNKRKQIDIVFQNASLRDKAWILLRKQFPDYHFSLQAPFSIQAQLSKIAFQNMSRHAIEQITGILRNRINELGVAEPVIQEQGADHISVDLPGIQDSSRAKELIGKVATIRLQLQDLEHDPLIAAKTGVIPFGSKLYHFEGHPVLLKNQVILRGTSIVNANSMFGENGQPAVQIRISGREVALFNRITAANIGKPLATIYVETKASRQLENGKVTTRYRPVERVVNLATISSALGHQFEVNNLPSLEYAKNLALLLRSGAYPVPVDFVQERVVGPSLGKQNIHMGVLATEIGSLLVIVFMIFYYRLFGLIADVALVLNIVFIIAVLSILGATLTLPGIAGVILTVGMAVDANVLINERIREELRKGISPQASIKAGYERAFSTIVDANVTTLIVMIVLFALGTGSIQGFAVTTTIGLLSSMLTAIFFTRLLATLIYGGRKKVSHLSIGIRLKRLSDKAVKIN